MDKTNSRNIYIYALLTRCEVKIAGYWPSYFVHFSSRFIKRIMKKERMRPISSHLDRTSLVNQKGFIIRLYFELKTTEKPKCGNILTESGELASLQVIARWQK